MSRISDGRLAVVEDWARGDSASVDRSTVRALVAEVRSLRECVAKVNDIRNSIIGFQRVGFSEHVYPLVAALEPIVKGLDYPEALKPVKAVLDRAESAEAELARLKPVADAVRAFWKAVDDHDYSIDDYCCELEWDDDLNCRDVKPEGSDEMCQGCKVVDRFYLARDAFAAVDELERA